MKIGNYIGGKILIHKRDEKGCYLNKLALKKSHSLEEEIIHNETL